MGPRSHNSRIRSAVNVTSYPLMEDAVFTLLSVLVVFAAAMLIMTPPRMAFELTVVESAHAASAKNIDLYGTLVNEAGTPIQGASVEVFDRNGKRVAKDTSNAQGEFATRFFDGRGAYTIVVTYTPPGGQPVTASIVLDCQTGMSYGLKGTLTQSNTIVFVPIPGY